MNKKIMISVLMIVLMIVSVSAVSAEGSEICGNGIDDDNDGDIDCADAQCQPCVNIQATKIVCDSEDDLPNWGGGSGPYIDDTTASDYVSNHPDDCYLEKDWSFQWRFDGSNPGDNNDCVGTWNTFGPTDSNGESSVSIANANSGKLWLRECLKPDYLNFSDTLSDEVTAEFYCDGDVLNYDNYDYIKEQISHDDTFYCVAFNVMEECDDDADCAPDNNYCSATNTWVNETESCVNGVCVPASSTGICQDDGEFCNGDEICSAGSCISTGNPCDDGDICQDDCDDDNDVCIYDVNDTTGPATSNMNVDPVYNNGVFDIYADAEDECSNIEEAEYFVGTTGTAACGTPGTGDAMSATDGSFDELMEAIEEMDASVDQDGQNWACVQSKDDKGNWGNCVCTYFESDTVPPERVYDIMLNGVENPDELLICDDNPELNVTICDSQSWLQGGEFFLDKEIPPQSIPAPWTGYWLDVYHEYLDAGWHCADLTATIPLDGSDPVDHDVNGHQWTEPAHPFLEDGTHYINQIRGKDIVENWGKIWNQNLGYSFIIDRTPPVVEKELLPVDDVNFTCDWDSANGNDLTHGCYYVKDGSQVRLFAYDPDPQGTGEFAGDVIIHYKVYWSETGAEGTWSVIDSGQSSPDQDITFTLTGDSYHLVEFWAVDACGHESDHYWELDIIDEKAPVSEKTLEEGEFVLCGDNNYGYDDCAYVTQDTNVYLSCADQEPHPVGGEIINWKVEWKENWGDAWKLVGEYNQSGIGVNFKYEDYNGDSFHRLTWWCEDAFGNVEEEHVELDMVDTQAPEVDKHLGTPKIMAGYSSENSQLWNYTAAMYEVSDEAAYVTQNTTINLTCEDIGPHPVDDVKIYYKYYNDGDIVVPSTEGWELYSTPFKYEEDTFHQLYYYCEDALGNTGDFHYELDYVDTLPPVSTHAFTGPEYDNCSKKYIDMESRLVLECTDEGEHPVGEDYIMYRYKVDDGVFGPWTEYSDPIQFPEESHHLVEYYCVDKLGNTEAPANVADFYVDHTPPTTTKTYGDPMVDTEGGYPKWITQDTPITLSATDDYGEVHDSGVKYTKYRVTLVDDQFCESDMDCQMGAAGSGEWNTYDTPFDIDEDSCHLIEYYSADNVDKEETVKKQCVFVDTAAPETTKTVSEPKIPLCMPGTESYTTNRGVNQHGQEYLLTDIFGEESSLDVELLPSGEIEFSVDVPGTFETGTPDNVAFTFDTDNNGEADFQISYHSDETQHYPGSNWGYQEVQGGSWSGWMAVPPEFTLDQECMNVFSVKMSLDKLGGCGSAYRFGVSGWNQNGLPGEHIQFNFPESFTWGANWVGSEDYMQTQVGTGKDWLIHNTTEITLSCADVIPHPVNNVTLYWSWRYSELGDEWTEWSEPAVYSGPISFDESSYHEIKYWCEDALGNTEEVQYEIDAVDLDAPESWKEVGEEKVLIDPSCEPEQEICDYWITQETPISLYCEDYPVHPSGVDEILYRVDLDGEGFSSWMTYTEPITFDEDSNHTLEWKCVDNFGNEEAVKSELDKVDTAPPEINKFVIKDGERIYSPEEGVTQIAVQSGETLNFCAEVQDFKQTGDEGVGVDKVWARFSLLDDPFLEWDDDEQAYCYERTVPSKCGKWHYEVKANDSLGNEAEWTNGIEVIIDNVPPYGIVLNPHAGNNYYAGKIFPFYAPAVDFGGDYCTCSGCGEDQDCPASGVEYCDVYAVDYPFEDLDQSEIKNCYEDILLWMLQTEVISEVPDVCEFSGGGLIGHLLTPSPCYEALMQEMTEIDTEGPYVEYIGRAPYEDGVCQGYLTIDEETQLTDTVFMAWEVVDKAGNGDGVLKLALNPWDQDASILSTLTCDPWTEGTPITMNIEEKGELGVTPMFSNPATSEDELTSEAVITSEYSSEKVTLSAVIETLDEENPEHIADDECTPEFNTETLEFEPCLLDPELPGYSKLDSGVYKYTVKYWRGNQVVDTWSIDFTVDNTRPDMGIITPHEDGVYSDLMPVSVYVTDDTGIADETVMVKVAGKGHMFLGVCIGGSCEETDWILLDKQHDDMYSKIINLSAYGIDTEGEYMFDAVACDKLYDNESDLYLGDKNFSSLNPRNYHHCRRISFHGAEEITRPECFDGWDNDRDGSIDYDSDESCESPEDDSEEGYCGDNNVDMLLGEECDNGEGNKDNMDPVWGMNEGDGDKTYCSTSCSLYDVPGTWCGDGTVQSPEEACDAGVDNGVECTPGYEDSCTYCSSTCEEETLEGGYCGDGTVNGEEECEIDADCGEGYYCEGCACYEDMAGDCSVDEDCMSGYICQDAYCVPENAV